VKYLPTNQKTFLGMRTKKRALCFNIARLAFEEIRYEDLVRMVFVFVTKRQDISSLECLREVAKNIIDDENGILRSRWSSNVCRMSLSSHEKGAID